MTRNKVWLACTEYEGVWLRSATFQSNELKSENSATDDRISGSMDPDGRIRVSAI
jgi:hypothetical protein